MRLLAPELRNDLEEFLSIVSSACHAQVKIIWPPGDRVWFFFFKGQHWESVDFSVSEIFGPEGKLDHDAITTRVIKSPTRCPAYFDPEKSYNQEDNCK